MRDEMKGILKLQHWGLDRLSLVCLALLPLAPVSLAQTAGPGSIVSPVITSDQIRLPKSTMEATQQVARKLKTHFDIVNGCMQSIQEHKKKVDAAFEDCKAHPGDRERESVMLGAISDSVIDGQKKAQQLLVLHDEFVNNSGPLRKFFGSIKSGIVKEVQAIQTEVGDLEKEQALVKESGRLLKQRFASYGDNKAIPPELLHHARELMTAQLDMGNRLMIQQAELQAKNMTLGVINGKETRLNAYEQMFKRIKDTSGRAIDQYGRIGRIIHEYVHCGIFQDELNGINLDMGLPVRFEKDWKDYNDGMVDIVDFLKITGTAGQSSAAAMVQNQAVIEDASSADLVDFINSNF